MANEHSLGKSNQKEALSTETECSASLIGDNDYLSLQREAVGVNHICTTEMVKSLVVMVSKFSSEVRQLRIGNETLMTQLRAQQQPLAHVPSIRNEAALSAAANNATAESHRDVVCVAGGNPAATASARKFVGRPW
jgi:uncharacterized protein with von Willebrand factor type A (vWA) domain